MATTLTWINSTLGTKTGTGNANLISDLAALIASYSGNAAFNWKVASFSTAANPYYIALKRKDGSPGRILIFLANAAMSAANINPTLFGAVSLAAGNFWGAYFPAGNVDVPTNLNANSGTIFGDDSNAVKVSAQLGVSTVYTANMQPYYADCEAGVFICFQNPAAVAIYGLFMGDLVVDTADNAYACSGSFANSSFAGLGSSSAVMLWTPAATVPGQSTNARVVVNYLGNSIPYYQAYSYSGSFGAQTGASDILLDDTNAAAYFVPLQLVGARKGEGVVLKLRQIGVGPGQTSPFTKYNTTGPVTAAIALNAASSNAGNPWVTNFKL